MARPRKEGLDYFPHDVDASNDEKIEALEAIYGIAGYAVYFKLLERIYRSGGKLIIPDAEMLQILSRKLTKTPQELESIIDFSCRYGLFDLIEWTQNKILTSNGVKKRADVVVSKRNKEREKFNSGNKKFGEEQAYMNHKQEVFERDGFCCVNCGENNAELLTLDHKIPQSLGGTHEKDNLQTLCKSCNSKKSNSVSDAKTLPETTGETPQSKDKGKIKESESKEKVKKNFVIPSVELIREYCSERENNIDAEYFHDYNTARGWMVGKNKMKDWKAAVNTWENNDKKRKAEQYAERKVARF